MAEEHDTLAHQLADARWVAGLARRLCRDAAGADDLAQDAWLHALEARRPAARSPRSRGWFRRVLLNAARQRARGDSRRDARERSVARPEATPEDDLVARAEASTRLVAHVLALDDPYRQVILARYFDGLGPDELARRTGVNPSTVRTRLERGLALLRARLERDGGSTWLAAFAPLALGPLPVAPLVPVVAATAALPLSAGVLMALTAKLALAAAVLGVGLFFVWPEREIAPEAPLARSESRAEESAPREADEVSSRVSRSEVAPAQHEATPMSLSDAAPEVPVLDLEAERQAEVAPGAIEGIVVRGTVPLDGGHVDFQPGYHQRLSSDRRQRLARVTDGTLTRIAVGRDGRFALRDLPAGWYTVGVDTTETRNLPRGAHAGLGAQFDVEVFADRPGQRLVIVLGAASVVGHVYDDEGQPVVGAVVGLGRSGGSYLARLGTSFAETDSTGSFAFHDLLPEVYGISLASLPGQDDVDYVWQQLERLGVEETRVFDLGTPWRAVVWRGRVVHPDGAPVERGGTLGRESDTTGSYEEIDVTTLADFTLRVRPGRYSMRARVSTSDSGFRTDYLTLGEVDVPDADFERDLVLPGTTVRGRVTGVALEDLPKGLDLSLYPAGNQQPVQHASVTRAGTLVLYAVPPGEYRVDLWPALTAAPGTSLVVRDGDKVSTLEVPALRR